METVSREFSFSGVDNGPIRTTGSLQLSRAARAALLGLARFDLQFVDSDKVSPDEHALYQLIVAPDLEAQGPYADAVPVRLLAGMRDLNGEWDDRYEGSATLGSVAFDGVNQDGIGCYTEGVKVYGWNSGPMTERRVLFLGPNYSRVTPVLRGFDLHFAYDEDHEIQRIVARTELVSGASSQAVVEVTAGIRDGSGFWDDQYQAYVAFSLLCEQRETCQILQGTAQLTGADSGPITLKEIFDVPNRSQFQYLAFLRGFDVGFSSEEPEMGRLIVGVEATLEPSPNQVGVVTTVGIRDADGAWEEQYYGNIDYVLIGIPRFTVTEVG